MSLNDVYPNELISSVAVKLKEVEEIQPPEWSAFAKTGAHKERAPVEKDWWYTRAAAILRSVAVLGPIGVSKLRTKYGGKKRRGHKMPHFRKASGSIIRKTLQQLDKAGFTKFAEAGIHRGRVVTPKGLSLLDKTSIEIIKSKPKEERPQKKAEEKNEEPKEEKAEAKTKKDTKEIEKPQKEAVKTEAVSKEDKKPAEKKEELKEEKKPSEEKTEKKEDKKE